jgi:hypothetical protein
MLDGMLCDTESSLTAKPPVWCRGGVVPVKAFHCLSNSLSCIGYPHAINEQQDPWLSQLLSNLHQEWIWTTLVVLMKVYMLAKIWIHGGLLKSFFSVHWWRCLGQRIATLQLLFA